MSAQVLPTAPSPTTTHFTDRGVVVDGAAAAAIVQLAILVPCLTTATTSPS